MRRLGNGCCRIIGFIRRLGKVNPRITGKKIVVSGCVACGVARTIFTGIFCFVLAFQV